MRLGSGDEAAFRWRAGITRHRYMRGCQRDDTQVHYNEPAWRHGRLLRRLEADQEVERAASQDQVGLSLAAAELPFLVCAQVDGDSDAAVQDRKADRLHVDESHDALVVDHHAVIPKRSRASWYVSL